MTTSPVRRVESRSVVEQVAHEIRRSIIAGDLAPGQEFALREIAGHLGVSFIPVREALRTLENEGLVTTRPGKSAVVAPVNSEDLHAIYQLRRILEPDIASRSCQLLTAELLDAMEAQARAFGADEAGVDDVYAAHQEFHLALLAPAASQWDIRILRTLWRASERYVRLGIGRFDPDPREHDRRAHAHLELLDAFREGQPRAVKRAVIEHLKRNEEVAQRGLDQIEKTSRPASDGSRRG